MISFIACAKLQVNARRFQHHPQAAPEEGQSEEPGPSEELGPWAVTPGAGEEEAYVLLDTTDSRHASQPVAYRYVLPCTITELISINKRHLH